MIDVVAQAQPLQDLIPTVKMHHGLVTGLFVHDVALDLETEVQQRPVDFKILWLCRHVGFQIFSQCQTEGGPGILLDHFNRNLILGMIDHGRDNQ